MDKLDRQMLVFLERNPRITYKGLAEHLHLSIPAIQRRLTIMESSRRILGYRALVNLEAMSGVRAIVYGQMAGKMDRDMLSKIEGQGSIHTTSCGSLNSVYLLAHLHRILELDDVIRIAQDVCKIPNPQVILFGCGSIVSSCPPTIDDSRKGDVSTLSDVDYKIIRALHYNARKPIAAIAKEVELSPKTVRKRLSRMVSENLIEFRTLSSIEGSGTLDFFVVVKLKSAESRPSVLKKLREDPQFYVDSSIVVSNARDLLFFEMQTETVNEMSRIVEDIRALKEVESVSPDLIQKVYYFEIWRDRMLEDAMNKKSEMS
jgi:DNA-binding Lrp family transcriptional regulator